MCERFMLFEPDTIFSKEFGTSILFDISPRYNVAPSQQAEVVRSRPDSSKRKFALLLWGLIPSNAKDTSIGNRMINARARRWMRGHLWIVHVGRYGEGFQIMRRIWTEKEGKKFPIRYAGFKPEGVNVMR